jgi:hypothetical protein
MIARKPLIRVGVTNISLDPTRVEAALERVFHEALKLNAVLLLYETLSVDFRVLLADWKSDEADVFLEAREEGGNNLKRNAMVSGTT